MSQFGGDNFGMGDTGGMGGGTSTPPKKNPVKTTKDSLLRIMGGYSPDKDSDDTAATAYATRYSHNEAVSKIRKQ